MEGLCCGWGKHAGSGMQARAWPRAQELVAPHRQLVRGGGKGNQLLHPPLLQG